MLHYMIGVRRHPQVDTFGRLDPKRWRPKHSAAGTKVVDRMVAAHRPARPQNFNHSGQVPCERTQPNIDRSEGVEEIHAATATRSMRFRGGTHRLDNPARPGIDAPERANQS